MIIGNSATNYKTDAGYKSKFYFYTILKNIMSSTIQRQNFFRSDYNWFTSTNLVLKALMFTVSKTAITFRKPTWFCITAGAHYKLLRFCKTDVFVV